MFTHLMLSEGRGAHLIGPGTLTVSAGLHAVALGLLLALAVSPGARSEAPPELVTFLDIEPERPAPVPAPEPEPPPATAVPASTLPPPKGFQELVPPTVPPAAIPDIDLAQPAVRVEDFSGVGKVGGVATGVAGGTPQNVADTAPVVAAEAVFEIGSLDYDERPTLRNRDQLPSILARYYPKLLADAGLEGRTVLRFVILPNGRVDPASVRVVSSTHEEFGRAAEQVLGRFRFSPGRHEGRAVRVLTEIPITWSIRQ